MRVLGIVNNRQLFLLFVSFIIYTPSINYGFPRNKTPAKSSSCQSALSRLSNKKWLEVIKSNPLKIASSLTASRLDKLNEEEKEKTARLLIEHDPALFFNLKELGLSEEVRDSIILSIIQTTPQIILQNFDSFKISQESKRLILEKLAEQRAIIEEENSSLNLLRMIRKTEIDERKIYNIYLGLVRKKNFKFATAQLKALHLPVAYELGIYRQLAQSKPEVLLDSKVLESLDLPIKPELIRIIVDDDIDLLPVALGQAKLSSDEAFRIISSLAIQNKWLGTQVVELNLTPDQKYELAIIYANSEDHASNLYHQLSYFFKANDPRKIEIISRLSLNNDLLSTLADDFEGLQLPESQVFSFAIRLLRENSSAFFQNFSKFKITNHSELIHLLKEALKSDAESSLEFLPLFKDWNENEKWKIAEILSKSEVSLDEILKHLGPFQRSLFPLLLGQTDFDSVNEWITKANLSSAEKFTIALEWLNEPLRKVLNKISKWGFNEDELFNIIQVYIQRNELPDHFEKQLYDLPIARPRLLHLFKEILRRNPDIALLNKIAIETPLDVDEFFGLKRFLLGQRPIWTLQYYGYRVKESTPWRDADSTIDIERSLYDLAQREPQLLDPASVTLLYDRVQKRSVALGLLKILTTQSLQKTNNSSSHGSWGILTNALGFKQIPPFQVQSSRDLNLFYELAIELLASQSEFSDLNIQFNDHLLRDEGIKQLNSFFHSLRNFLSIQRANTRSKFPGLLKYELKDIQLNKNNIDTIRKKVEESIVSSVRDLLKGSDVEFSYEQLMKLEADWGDIEPVITLLTRFSGNEDHKEQIKLLADVFRYSLRGQFDELKFHGKADDQDDRDLVAAQLSTLDDSHKLSLWKKQRFKLGLYTKGDIADDLSADERVRQFRAHLETQLKNHLSAIPTPGPDAQDIIDSLLVNHSPTPQKSLELIKENYASQIASADHLLSIIFYGLQTQNEIHALKKLITLISANSDYFKISRELREDIRSMIKLLDIQRVLDNSSIIFTTTFYHPKLMLTIGDMVDASSCQNYKTGEYIQHLMGYVLDANTQGMVSFALKPEDFENVSDYHQIWNRIRSQLPLQAELLGGNRIVKFSWQTQDSTITLVSRPLKYGYRRHIVRLGATLMREPGIVLEKSYDQTHPAQILMEAQALAIRDELANDLNGTTEGEIEISRTRNPQGVWSDAGGGSQEGDFTVTND